MPKSLLDVSPKKLFWCAAIATTITLVLGLLAIFSDTLQKIDQGAEFFLIGARTLGRNEFFLAITYFGSIEFVGIATIFLGIILFIRKDMPHFIIFLGTVLSNSASIVLLKDLVERTRPMQSIYTEPSFSFPSGHTAMSVVFYGLLFYLAGRNVKRNNTRGNLLFIWVFAMLMIGFSRMYLGVHFASDVLAGYAVGFFWLCVGIMCFEFLFSKKQKMTD